mmetsp:Transcript_35793/g.84115  ORF Transcript_35793/g.84115 Transcript_35793/m.84115 type:complete len:203 (+) Transcript_35793:364-972(+)
MPTPYRSSSCPHSTRNEPMRARLPRRRTSEAEGGGCAPTTRAAAVPTPTPSAAQKTTICRSEWPRAISAAPTDLAKPEPQMTLSERTDNIASVDERPSIRRCRTYQQGESATHARNTNTTASAGGKAVEAAMSPPASQRIASIAESSCERASLGARARAGTFPTRYTTVCAAASAALNSNPNAVSPVHGAANIALRMRKSDA